MDPFWQRFHIIQVTTSSISLTDGLGETPVSQNASKPSPSSSKAGTKLSLLRSATPHQILDLCGQLSIAQQRLCYLRILAEPHTNWFNSMSQSLAEDRDDAIVFMLLLSHMVQTLEGVRDPLAFAPYIPKPTPAPTSSPSSSSPSSSSSSASLSSSGAVKGVSLLSTIRTPSLSYLPFVPFLWSKASCLSLCENLWAVMQPEAEKDVRVAFTLLTHTFLRAGLRFCAAPAPAATAAAVAAAADAATEQVTSSSTPSSSTSSVSSSSSSSSSSVPPFITQKTFADAIVSRELPATLARALDVSIIDALDKMTQARKEHANKSTKESTTTSSTSSTTEAAQAVKATSLSWSEEFAVPQAPGVPIVTLAPAHLSLSLGPLMKALQVGGAAAAKQALGVQVVLPGAVAAASRTVTTSSATSSSSAANNKTASSSLSSPPSSSSSSSSAKKVSLLHALISICESTLAPALIVPLKYCIREQQNDEARHLTRSEAEVKEARNKFLELAKAGKLSVKDVAEGGVFDKGIVEGMKSLNIDLPSSDGTAGSKNNDTNESENVSGSDKNNRSSSSISNSSSSRDGNASITAEEGDAALLSRYRLRTSLLDYLRDAEALIMVIADLCNYVPSQSVPVLAKSDQFHELYSLLAAYNPTYVPHDMVNVGNDGKAEDAGANAEGKHETATATATATEDATFSNVAQYYNVAGLARMVVGLCDNLTGLSDRQQKYLKELDKLASTATAGAGEAEPAAKAEGV